MKVIDIKQIREVLPRLDLLSAIEQGFVAYSAGQAVIPPVGELLFQDPPGDVHIKYGYLQQDPYYVVKIASGFYKNPILNLPSSNGLMLLFSQQTGELHALLLDEGLLTDVRTAIAGAIAAKYLAPKVVKCIGIVGTGIQAHLQLRYLAQITVCRDVMVWGRDEHKLSQYSHEMEQEGFSIRTTHLIETLAAACNIIVTTTSATAPLLSRIHIRRGTHITAVGADTSSKQELDPAILRDADLVVADSIEQCRERGEIAHALKRQFLEEKQVVELGQIIVGARPRRTHDDQITVADLTGVAVQDIQIAKAVYQAITEKHI